MATRSKAKGRAKAHARNAKRSAKRGMTAAKKMASSKRSASATSARKASAKKASARPKSVKAAARKRAPVSGALNSVAKAVRESPVDRVARVATEVAQQATHAVSEGVDALKELGTNLVDRVAGQ